MDISSRSPADRRASEVLDGIAASAQGVRVSLGDIMASLEERAGATIFLGALLFPRRDVEQQPTTGAAIQPAE